MPEDQRESAERAIQALRDSLEKAGVAFTVVKGALATNLEIDLPASDVKLSIDGDQLRRTMDWLIHDDTWGFAGEDRLGENLVAWAQAVVDDADGDVSRLFLVATEPNYFVDDSPDSLTDIQERMVLDQIRVSNPDADWYVEKPPGERKAR